MAKLLITGAHNNRTIEQLVHLTYYNFAVTKSVIIRNKCKRVFPP